MGYGHNKLSLEEAEELLKEVNYSQKKGGYWQFDDGDGIWQGRVIKRKRKGSDKSFTQADLDGDGKLDYTEFTQMMLWDLED